MSLIDVVKARLGRNDHNPYGASVALERVEEGEGVRPEGGTVRLHYDGVAP